MSEPSAGDVLLQIELFGVAQLFVRVHLLFHHAQVVADHHDLVKKRFERHFLCLERPVSQPQASVPCCQRVANPSTIFSGFSSPRASTITWAVWRMSAESGICIFVGLALVRAQRTQKTRGISSFVTLVLVVRGLRQDSEAKSGPAASHWR